MRPPHSLEVKFLPQAPSLPAEVLGSSRVMPVLPCTLAFTAPATWATGKSNRDHCPVLELRCLWTNQASAFKGMSLKSLLDWIRAVGPIPSIPAIPPGLGGSRDLPRSSTLASVGGQSFTAPAAWLHGGEWN